MKIWKVTICNSEDDVQVDTYRGISQDARQAIASAISLALADTNAAINELVECEQMTTDEVSKAIPSEFYASEVSVISDVEFGL